MTARTFPVITNVDQKTVLYRITAAILNPSMVTTDVGKANST